MIKDIVFISDTHNEHSRLELPSADLCIHSGDAGIKGNYTELSDFLSWYVKQPFKYKIFVWGNHDRKMYVHPDLQAMAKEYGIICLNDELIEIEGLKIYGNPKVFPSIDRKESKEEREEAWKNIPKNIDILITHQPPFGVLDMAARGAHIGCPELYKKVWESEPKLHVFGHCHEDKGKEYQLNKTKCMNIAVKDRSYILVDYRGYYYKIEDLGL